ncbi:MAG: hypothetical protein ACYDG2_01740 [Ruminiclostridium sp.]
MTEKKQVTYKHLKKEQEIHGWAIGNSTSMCTAIVKDKNPAFVSVLVWGERPEKVPSEGTMFIVDRTEQEIQRKYAIDAVKVVKAFHTKLADYEIGYHEMWNAWTGTNPYEFAQMCRNHKLTILGVCENVWQPSRGNDRYVGVCVMDEDGDKFWCHVNMCTYDYITQEYKHWLE